MTPACTGGIIARLLAGAWRRECPPPEVEPEELQRVAPLLHRTGTGALAWWRVRDTALADTETGEGLRQAYRLHTLEGEVHALRLTAALDVLDAAGVDALLIKGWGIARHYPEVGLRPYTDIDLILRPGQAEAARSALAAAPGIRCPVDLHDSSSRVDASGFDDLAEHAEAIPFGARLVRILGPEDHLRVLALHALRHGVFRPLWLVDLAVCLEGRPPEFDWDRCLGPVRRRAEWVIDAVALAERLLGATCENTPVAGRADTLPDWLIRAVLRNWARGEGRSHLAPIFDAIVSHRRRPGLALAEAWRRWDRPIEATLEVGAAFNHVPRCFVQVAAVARRTPELWRALRRASADAPGPIESYPSES
jgi:putative nucleotidyltransferase-like protein